MANVHLSHLLQIKKLHQPSVNKMAGSYALLFAISMWLNRRDGKMLLLTLVVGCGIFVSVPDNNFYIYCISGEILICFAADIIGASASRFVIWCCLSLVAIHFLGWISKGFEESDPYPYMVQLFEHSQLIACVFLSTPLLTRKKND